MVCIWLENQARTLFNLTLNSYYILLNMLWTLSHMSHSLTGIVFLWPSRLDEFKVQMELSENNWVSNFYFTVL